MLEMSDIDSVRVDWVSLRSSEGLQLGGDFASLYIYQYLCLQGLIPTAQGLQGRLFSAQHSEVSPTKHTMRGDHGYCTSSSHAVCYDYSGDEGCSSNQSQHKQEQYHVSFVHCQPVFRRCQSYIISRRILVGSANEILLIWCVVFFTVTLGFEQQFA